MSKPVIIIFNSLLLPPSQTFIRDPVEKLEQHIAYYVGSRQVKGLELPLERVLVINEGNSLGKLQEQVFKVTGYAPLLYEKVKRLNPVLIHAQFGLSGVLMLPWARSLKIPLIVHYRGADATVIEKFSRHSSLNHWIYYQRKETLKEEAALFLTVSKFIKNKLIAQGFPADKIRTHYHGVDINKFSPNPAINREPIVLFVGRLTEKKGCEYLIQAMSQVQHQHPDYKLVVIGDGVLRTSLETLASQTLCNYQFLGVQSPETVKNWMNRARIMAVPSITTAQGDSEGLPNVVLEAQAMELPVVSTYHAGIPEAVIDKKTGFLSQERDIKGLANAILRLFNDDELWRQFSYRGREHMKTNFNQSKQAKKLDSIYDKLRNSSLTKL
jgi:glycosyltransferase involved in cell wall biosynthesis